MGRPHRGGRGRRRRRRGGGGGAAGRRRRLLPGAQPRHRPPFERPTASGPHLRRAARAAHVRRLVYLGGLYPDVDELSPHLRSRKEVGEILLASGVPTAVLRAAVIIGSGSASFEMLRYLTERLPVMITPRWVDNRIQPIAVRDVLRYLVGGARPAGRRQPRLRHRRARRAHLPADDAALRRGRGPVAAHDPAGPGADPRPVQPLGRARHARSRSSIARPLVESLVHEVVCKEHDIAAVRARPARRPLGFDRAVELALAKVQALDVATRWSSASVPGAPSDPLPTDPDWAGGSLYVDERSSPVDASREALWRSSRASAAQNGWYCWPFGWWARGVLDRLAGGPGLRRGRRNPLDLSVGRRARLVAGRGGRRPRAAAAARRDAAAGPRLAGARRRRGRRRRRVFRQRAIFAPRGLAGHAYWWAVKPFHGIVFGGMQRGIAAEAERVQTQGQASRWRGSGNLPGTLGGPTA